MMRSVETVCSNSCYMLADKKHFRHRSRLAGTAMLPKRLSTSKKKKKKVMYCIMLQIYKREHIQNLPEPFC